MANEVEQAFPVALQILNSENQDGESTVSNSTTTNANAHEREEASRRNTIAAQQMNDELVPKNGAANEKKNNSTSFINIYSYVAIASIMQFWYYFYMAYSIACLTTIERRYGWPRYDDLKRFFFI